MKINNLSKIISSFTVYKFLEALTTPFIHTAAYKKGIIDSKGIQIKPDEELTTADKIAYTDFDRLVFSLRRLILMVPDPYVRKNMTNVITVLNLISEECEKIGGDKQFFMETVKREMSACRLFEEEGGAAPAPITTSVGAGGIAGFKPEEIGVPVEAQKRHTQKNMIFKRKKPNKYYNDETGNY